MISSHHPIEVEIRGEVSVKKIPALARKLATLGFTHASSTKRTSVMSFGTVSCGANDRHRVKGKKRDGIDIRCRVTNGRAEVVAKIGQTDAANRVEIAIPVSQSDMIHFAQLFGATPLFTKVGSKKTDNFSKDGVVVSLVTSPSGLAYVEIEMMSTRKRERKDIKTLHALAKVLDLHLWKTRAAFLTFCNKLTKRDDWMFEGTPTQIKRLTHEIAQTGSAIP